MANMNVKNLLFGLCIAFVVISASVVVASAKTCYVPDDYAEIQWAIDNATAGDTIIVKKGTYYVGAFFDEEKNQTRIIYPIVLDKTLNLIGEGMPIINGSGIYDIIKIRADSCVVDGFRFVGNMVSNCVELHNSSNCKILNNIFEAEGCDRGIYSYNSSNNTILSNICKGCSEGGIFLHKSKNNTISKNVCDRCRWGIYLVDSSNNTILINTCKGCGIGIGMFNSSNNTFLNCKCEGGERGIYLGSSLNSTISNNICEGCEYGIYLIESSNNSISNNTCEDGDYGIYLFKSSNNYIYLNDFVNNTYNAFLYWAPKNFWNSSKKITYNYNESRYENYLGNYWDDYRKRNPHAGEIYGGGFWDWPYGLGQLDAGHYQDADRYPLKEPKERYMQVKTAPTPAPSPIGFEAVSAIAGLLAVVYLMRRKR